MSTTTLAGLLLLLFQIEMFLHFFCVFMHSKIRMVFEILFLIQNSLTSNEILYFPSCVFVLCFGLMLLKIRISRNTQTMQITHIINMWYLCAVEMPMHGGTDANGRITVLLLVEKTAVLRAALISHMHRPELRLDAIRVCARIYAQRLREHNERNTM